jgi:threonine synthase
MSVRYISTRGGEPLSFSDAVIAGLAVDGGLFVPDSVPDVSAELDDWRGLDYASLAERVMQPYVDVSADVLKDLVSRSYSVFSRDDVVPLVSVGDLSILELFHGPTLAFKDIALQFLGNLFEHLLDVRDARLNILAATSGDTGSAAIYGVRGRSRMRIFVTYPDGRVSPMQELQMTAVDDENVFNLALQGTFDDCQAIVKAVLGDVEFKERFALGTVNSINWARVLAQVVYYFYSAFRVMEQRKAAAVDFCVPTGNFGDVYAGYVAWRMGLPIRKLVVATNENDILARFFAGSDYSRGEVQATISPSMDIQIASNFERYLFDRVGREPARLSALMNDFASSGVLSAGSLDPAAANDPFCAGSADVTQTLETIRQVHADYGYVLDPHSAVGVHVGQAHRDPDVPMICLATAHPAKFGGAVQRAIGEQVRHPILEALRDVPRRRTVMPASEDAVRQMIFEHAGR